MTNEEFSNLPQDEQNEWLSGCERGWSWANRWRKRTDELFQLLWIWVAIAAAGWGVSLILFIRSI